MYLRYDWDDNLTLIWFFCHQTTRSPLNMLWFLQASSLHAIWDTINWCFVDGISTSCPGASGSCQPLRHCDNACFTIVLPLGLPGCFFVLSTCSTCSKLFESWTTTDMTALHGFSSGLSTEFGSSSINISPTSHSFWHQIRSSTLAAGIFWAGFHTALSSLSIWNHSNFLQDPFCFSWQTRGDGFFRTRGSDEGRQSSKPSAWQLYPFVDHIIDNIYIYRI